MRLRPPHLVGGFYHVMLRGNRKAPIFADDRDRWHLNWLVERSLRRHAAEVHAYCWMTNHVHLLVRVGEVPLYRLVHHFASQYARYFNARYELVGHLFQGRYRSRVVDSDGYFLQLIRYIHRNPVEGGLCERVEAYRWSSLATYLGRERSGWLTTRCALAYFADDPGRLLDFVQKHDEDFDPWPRPGANPACDATVVPEPSEVPAWPDLESLLDAACVRFGIDLRDLEGPGSSRDLTLARSWIGDRAVRCDVATLSAVARRLNRSPASLSRSIRRNAARLEKAKG